MGRATIQLLQEIIAEEISIHALRGEGDSFIFFCPFLFLFKFQSTPSVGRATSKLYTAPDPLRISIHALRGEGDRILEKCVAIEVKFQSTPSVGRATATTG